MGLVEMYGRWVRGEPIFQPQDEKNHDSPSETGAPTQDAHGIEQPGAKVIPKIFIEETDCHVNGHHMEVRCVIKNESAQHIEIDKIFILGVKREVDVHLKPHEARQAIMYKGELPNHQNYGQADLNYRTTEPPADYFQIKCRVEFKPENDGTFSVRRITQQGPVKDIQ